MATKVYDIAVKTGEYIKDGETKGRYENIGAVMKGDDGSFVILKRTFNPAGVPNPENRDTLIASLFSDKPKQQQAQVQQAPPPQQPPAQQHTATPAAAFDNFDEDVPF